MANVKGLPKNDSPYREGYRYCNSAHHPKSSPNWILTDAEQCPICGQRLRVRVRNKESRRRESWSYAKAKRPGDADYGVLPDALTAPQPPVS